jgi:hypothetical protein
MSRTNNDFGQSAEFLIGGEKESIGKTLGTFHKLPPELHETLTVGKRECQKMKKWHNDAMERQRATRYVKRNLPWNKNLMKQKRIASMQFTSMNSTFKTMLAYC